MPFLINTSYKLPIVSKTSNVTKHWSETTDFTECNSSVEYGLIEYDYQDVFLMITRLLDSFQHSNSLYTRLHVSGTQGQYFPFSSFYCFFMKKDHATAWIH